MSANERTFLSEAFTAAARAGLSRAERRTWDPGLARDPRLLVPVDVRAMVVAPGEGVEHADVATSLLTADPGGPGAVRRAPDPFSDAAPRAAGVYLHWALPDGLTQGRAAATPGAAVELRPLPDRWVVLRIEPGERRRVRGWVLESEKGRRTPLEDWPLADPAATAAARTPQMAARDHNAAAGGDAAWAAVFDNVEDRFALFDDLADVQDPARPLSYLVVGWYSAPELDPLHLDPGEGTFEELMAALGWALDPHALEKVRAEIARRRRATATVGLASRPLLSAALAAQVDPAVPPAATRAAKAARPAQAGEPVLAPISTVPGKLLLDAASVAIKTSPWCPRQSLYEGLIHGVTIDPAARRDPRPVANDVRLAVGATGNESLAATLAAAMSGDAELNERLQTAFGYGLIDAFEDPDGVPRLEAELHARAYGSEHGGFREERIRAGDPIAPLAGPPERRGKRAEQIGERLGALTAAAGRPVRFELLARPRAEILDLFALKAQPDRIVRPPDPLRFETVRRALPRWHFPQDPVLTLQGLRRSLRHGWDGRFDPGETLACRLSGDPAARLAGLVDGAELIADPPRNGAIPPEVDALLREAVLADPSDEAADRVTRAAAKQTGLEAGAVRARVEGERRLFLRAMAAASDAPRLLTASLRDGVLPSPVAWTPFAQAWVPLYVEWRLELSLDDRADRWALGELDLEPRPGETAAGGEPISLSGRSLLTSAGAKTFAAQVGAFLSQEKALDDAGRGLISDDAADGLRAIAAGAASADVLGAAFEGLRAHLLGFDADAQLAPPSDGAEVPPPAPERPPRLLRAGSARLTALRVVDAFGRVLELPPDALEQALVAESLRVPPEAQSHPGELLLAPRITQSSRLLLRLLDAADDDREVTIDQETPAAAGNPVAAWLLPDHVDGALEVFDGAGEPVGQLRHETLGGGVVWEGAPGRPEPVGAPPPPSLSRHAAAFATELIRRDAGDRAAGAGPDRESPLAALLRVIDTTLWTVDPFGQTGAEHLALLVGRPIAMVRAELRLELKRDADEFPQLDAAARAAREDVFRALSDRAFDVRLGALTRQDDGLLGYFVDDDYTRLYPVHAQVPREALPAGRHEGYLGPADATAQFDATLAPSPIRQPYVEFDPTVSVRPGQVVRLTLLLDPGSKVHVTSGILPRKSIALLRDWIAPALARIAPSFRFGPVLVDPTTVRMPQPTGLPKEQDWTHRDTPLTWRDDPIMAATQEALLPDEPALAQEGYVRVRFDEG